MTLNLNNILKTILIVILTITSINLNAQRNVQKSSNNFKHKPHFTLEQRAALKTKRMTLHLDLNKSQQKIIHQITLNNIKKNKRLKKQRKMAYQEGYKPTKLDLFIRLNNRLDNQIALQRKFRKILNDHQYMQWRKQRFIKERKFMSRKNRSRNNRKFIN